MTVSSNDAKTGPYTGNGSTDAFAYDFYVEASTEIVVTLTSTTSVDSTVSASDYSVSGVGSASGGNVTMDTPPALNEKLTITRLVPATQLVDLQNLGTVQPDIIEGELDKLTRTLQDQQTDISSALKLSPSASAVDLLVPVPVADRYLAWNAAADALENKDIASVSAISLPVPVASGGTGTDTLTDGGVLLGNGTGAVQAMAVLADGAMIVGDGTTDPVAESGATLRTSIGVGTGDSPQFTAINVGHASDTTLAKEASGVLAVEGNTIASLDLKQIWTKAQAPSTFSATLASVSGVLDYDAFQNFIITLASGSNTLAAPTTEADCIGQTGVMIFIQPSSSSAGTLSLHADYETAASAGITLSTANNDYDIVPYVVKADNSIMLGAPQLNFG